MRESSVQLAAGSVKARGYCAHRRERTLTLNPAGRTPLRRVRRLFAATSTASQITIWVTGASRQAVGAEAVPADRACNCCSEVDRVRWKQREREGVDRTPNRGVQPSSRATPRRRQTLERAPASLQCAEGRGIHRLAVSTFAERQSDEVEVRLAGAVRGTPTRYGRRVRVGGHLGGRFSNSLGWFHFRRRGQRDGRFRGQHQEREALL